jgi:hypothetical protein
VNTSFRVALAAVSSALLGIALAAHASPEDRHGAPPPKPAPAAQKAERCAEHGVQRSLCARCNPKLATVYKAKGDWCGEHERPESQCVLCHPELAKEGVK